MLSSLTSADGRFDFVYQRDGNVVLYQGPTPLWASQTAGHSDGSAVMQADGNFVVYDAAGRAAWASNTPGNPGASLHVQNDGNVVIYAINGTPLWATGTAGHGPPPPGGCVNSVSPNYVQIVGAGGTVPLTVTAPAGCAASVVSRDAWVVVGAGQGTGTWATTYQVLPNSVSDLRRTALIVGNATVLIEQPRIGLVRPYDDQVPPCQPDLDGMPIYRSGCTANIPSDFWRFPCFFEWEEALRP